MKRFMRKMESSRNEFNSTHLDRAAQYLNLAPIQRVLRLLTEAALTCLSRWAGSTTTGARSLSFS